MPLLSIAAIVWIAIHLGIAGTALRDAVVRRIGEAPFRGVFSVLSLLSLVFLVRAWDAASSTLLWIAPDWLRWLLVLAMLPAFVLFVGSVSGRNPTMIGPRDGGRDGGARPASGIIRVTRHPMLWSFAIWAGVHIIGNGDTAAIVFFGAYLVTALAGMPSIDAKLRHRDQGTWQALSAATSIVPFAAIAQGRNRLVLREIGWAHAGDRGGGLDRAADAASVVVRRGSGRPAKRRISQSSHRHCRPDLIGGPTRASAAHSSGCKDASVAPRTKSGGGNAPA